MKTVVITFPGSNCDRDCVYVLRDLLSCPVQSVFHKDTSLGECDAVIIPGGFSYGDYLRSGALAVHSPIMPDLKRFAERGGLVIGICNGFQILCEAGLLPGALVHNKSLQFISRVLNLRVENNDTPFSSAYDLGQQIHIPVAHGDGCYFADEQTLDSLTRNQQIVFRYDGPRRADSPDGNPNGSAEAIAGIVNEQGNVLGMMPHPERASDAHVGSTDGLGVFRSMISAIKEGELFAAARG